MMTFQEVLGSQIFFNVLMKNETFFNSLRAKFPDILADLVSSRTNPNCSCKNRVSSYLASKLQVESKYFGIFLKLKKLKI